MNLLLNIRKITDAENRWADPRSFLNLLLSAATVEAPDTREVEVGFDFPSGTPRPPLFVRVTASGDFAGLYSFVAGEYRRIDNFPHPGETRGIVDFVVDVTELQPGWHLADGTNGTADLSADFVGSAPSYDYAIIQYTGA